MENSLDFKDYNNSLPLEFKTFYKGDYNNIRRLKVITISNTLGNYEDFKSLDYNKKTAIMRHIEESCINETIRKSKDNNQRCVWDNKHFLNIYHDVCYRVISIIENNDKKLLANIINGSDEFLNTIAKKSCKDLLPEKYEEITLEITKRVNTKQTVKFTEMYFCKKCKRNQTTVERVQNRSNDEASSFFVTCLFCGTKWFT
ncbi:MAG: hypothetical protein ACRCZI_05925 [Cetobacterium sp.]